MKTKRILFAGLFLLIVIASCNPVKRTTSNLVGEWRVVSYQEQVKDVKGLETTNIGTITLNSDKTGTRLVSYSILGLAANDTTSFRWSNTENSIFLDTKANDETRLWIISEMKKNSQVWITTDGKENMQTIVLERIK